MHDCVKENFGPKKLVPTYIFGTCKYAAHRILSEASIIYSYLYFHWGGNSGKGDVSESGNIREMGDWGLWQFKQYFCN